jgi:hypothetical protein
MSSFDDLRLALRANLSWREGNLSQYGIETATGSHHNRLVASFRLRDYLTSAAREIGAVPAAQTIEAANVLLDEMASIRKERNEHAAPAGGSKNLAAASPGRRTAAAA